MSQLLEELTDLHDRYVELVNLAVADDDLDRAERLAACYDTEAIQLVAAHETGDRELHLV